MGAASNGIGVDVLVGGEGVAAARVLVGVGVGVVVAVGVAVWVGVGVAVGTGVRVGVGVGVGVRVGVGVFVGVSDGVRVGIRSRRPGTSVATSRAETTTARGRKLSHACRSRGPAHRPSSTPSAARAASRAGRNHSRLSGSPHCGQSTSPRLAVAPQLRQRILRARR